MHALFSNSVAIEMTVRVWTRVVAVRNKNFNWREMIIFIYDNKCIYAIYNICKCCEYTITIGCGVERPKDVGQSKMNLKVSNWEFPKKCSYNQKKNIGNSCAEKNPNQLQEMFWSFSNNYFNSAKKVRHDNRINLLGMSKKKIITLSDSCLLRIVRSFETIIHVYIFFYISEVIGGVRSNCEKSLKISFAKMFFFLFLSPLPCPLPNFADT